MLTRLFFTRCGGLLPALFLLFSTSIFAQKITGSVAESRGEPLAFATVTLHQAKDSSLAKGAVSDAQGHFEMEGMRAGRYFVRAQMVSFKRMDSAVFDFGTADVAVPTLVLPAASTLR